MTSEESLTEFKEDLLDELDILRLEPVSIKKVLIITVIMYVLAIIFIVFFAVFQTAWYSVLLIIGVGLILIGSFNLYFEAIRLSDDKNIYVFDRDGFRTESVDGEQSILLWRDVDDLKIRGRYGPHKRKRRCLFTTKSGEIELVVDAFNEVTAQLKHPDKILYEILKYYERMKAHS